MDDHTTADDATRYRDPEIVKEWETKDPINRLQIYLTQKYKWNDERNKALVTECAREVEQAVQEYEAEGVPDPAGMFEQIYTEMPWNLKAQQAAVKATEGGR